MTASAPEDLLAFRTRRESELAAPHGVLSQVGLHWVDPADGAHAIDGLPGTWRREGEVLEVGW